MKRLLSEPLLHFLLIGAALFAVFAALSGDEPRRDDHIVVPAGKVEHLTALFERTWQRPPTTEELKGLIDDHVRDELAYREGVALGLDRDDTIVRRRIRQKLDFIAEEVATLTEPTDAELGAFLAEYPEKFTIDDHVWFRQVFLDPDLHAATLDADTTDLLGVLNDDPAADPASLGDKTMLEHAHADRSTQDIVERFGDGFAGALAEADTNTWFGPVPSAFGVHLVRIDRREPGRLPELDEIRDLVKREWDADRRQAAVERYYNELLERYIVSIEWPTKAARRLQVTRWLACALLICAALSTHAAAHEVRPAYLQLTETQPGTFDVLWKTPARGERRLGLYVRLPADCERLTEPTAIFQNSAHIERWRISHADALVGSQITIDGLASTRTDVLVRIERLDGSTLVARMSPSEPTLTIVASPGVALTYLALGVEHILSGVDHLLFVLSLMLLVKGWRRLVETITAFTLAHSVTLALASLGILNVPGPPVEAAYRGFSIVFISAEIVWAYRGRHLLAEKSPWLVAAGFGLLHGLGFAGALADIGMPEHAIPLSLFFFNLGVEFGQLIFVAAAAIVFTLARRTRLRPPGGRLLLPYAIGSVAMFWVIERVAAF